MTMIEAARMGDKVAHTNALLGFLGGMVLGAAMAVGLALLAGATIATGGGALILAGALLAGAGGGALAGMNLGANGVPGFPMKSMTYDANTGMTIILEAAALDFTKPGNKEFGVPKGYAVADFEMTTE